jgi:glycerate 2-kinase
VVDEGTGFAQDSAARSQLESLFRAGIAAVDGGAAVRRALVLREGRLEIAGRPLAPGSELVVLAVGKAAAGMAFAVEQVAPGILRGGLVVTKDGHGRTPLRQLVLRETGHPVPDARCASAAREAEVLISGMRPEDTLLILLSGGASSLLACPADSLALEDVEELTRMLLASGADIAEMNVVRKHVSSVSGGRLARSAAARRIDVLAISDVPGDDISVIGSGPFAPDPSSFAAAREVLRVRGIWDAVPEAVRLHLERGCRGQVAETPKPGDPALHRVTHHIVARNKDAIEAALAEASRQSLRALSLASVLSGEARAAGVRLAALGLATQSARPICLVAGGETTVTIRGEGRGGRCQELALAAALALEGRAHVTLLAAGTDGTDGPTDAAGAFVDGSSCQRGARAGVLARDCLERNDSYGFFQAEGGLLRTGPTGTNVMDLVMLLCCAARV